MYTLIKNRGLKVKQLFNFKIVGLAILPLMILTIAIFQAGVNIPLTKIFAAQSGVKNNLINPFNHTVLFFGSIILGPLLEEIIFRGIILKGFLSTYNPKKSIILSAVIFALAHVHPTKIFGALMSGVFFGWIYSKTRSLGNCILLHFSSNLTSTIISYLIYKRGILSNNSMGYIYGSSTFYIISASIIVLIILIYKLYHQLLKNLPENHQNVVKHVECKKNKNTVIYNTFYNSIEAHIIKSKLDDAEFPCFLADDNISTLQYNQAVGGIKLIVYEKDIEQINALLRDTSRNGL